ncbi:Uncharacterised protein [Amycolatopsis camponoti]|uniref:Uncharacterized protein n=2 Tax=Amycolatopsis camponoti TaxID=2606593 RepID=A0A6I8LMU0_9PSEU|nr:Uncharacterised protein [Amycolatopsis camponoti]
MIMDHALNAGQTRTLIARLAASSSDRAPHVLEPTELQRRIDRAEQTKDPVDILWLSQLQTQVCPAADLGDLVAGVHRELQRQISSDARVHVLRRGRDLLHRSQLATVLLRVEYDPQLRAGNLKYVQAANAAGKTAFASSSGLSDGIFLLDAYAGSLLAALAPSIWAFTAHRELGVITYTLGLPLAGTRGNAAELLHILSLQGDPNPFTVPMLSANAGTAAIDWWGSRLNELFGVLTDPAVFTDQNGEYRPIKHLHCRMTVEQLFRRVNSSQIARRDINARRVLLFTVLDTLERVTGRDLSKLCSLPFAQKTLDTLRAGMPADAAEVLLPAADRAVAALKQVQDGFFMGHQPGSGEVTLTHTDNTVARLDAAVAAADYIKVLRDATHGHGSNRSGRVDRTNALLAHHDGTIPHDLGLLGYLYLLDVLANPDNLRSHLYRGGKV